MPLPPVLFPALIDAPETSLACLTQSFVDSLVILRYASGVLYVGTASRCSHRCIQVFVVFDSPCHHRYHRQTLCLARRSSKRSLLGFCCSCWASCCWRLCK